MLAPPAGSQSIMVVFKIQDVALGRRRVSCESDGQFPPPVVPKAFPNQLRGWSGAWILTCEPTPGRSSNSLHRVYDYISQLAQECLRMPRRNSEKSPASKAQRTSVHPKHQSNPRPYFWIQFWYLFSGQEVWLNLERRSYSARAKLRISCWLDSIELACWG